jgi:hypothetical protein
MSGNRNHLRDDELRSRFRALRREEEARTPEFRIPGSVTWRGRRRRTAGILAAAACLAAMLAAAYILPMLRTKPRHAGEKAVALTEWRSPTDFLLQTPGRELLRTVPAIASWQDGANAPVRRPRQQVRKHALP